MRVTSQRGGAPWQAVAGLVLGAAVGCFHPEFLAYAACDRSEPCADAGLYACVTIPAAPQRRGFCAVACEGESSCPEAETGAATPRCARVGVADVCVLSCIDEETCPDGQVCTEVDGIDGGAAKLCFPEVQP